MFFFNIFGFMMFIAFVVVIGIVMFFMSAARRAKRSFRRDPSPGDTRSYTSTGSSYQRYYTQNANNRSRAHGGSNAGSEHEVIEIPILEVTDITDKSK